MWIVLGKQERAAASSFYCNRSRVYSHWLYHPSGLNLPFLRDGSETVANNTLLPLLLSQWPEKTYDKVVEGKRENTEGHRHWTVDRGYHCQRIHADPHHPSHREERRRKEGREEELEEDERAREDEKAALRAMALRRKEHRWSKFEKRKLVRLKREMMKKEES